MPKRKRKIKWVERSIRRKSARRRPRRRYRYRQIAKRLQRGIGLPRSCLIKMRYATTLTLDMNRVTLGYHLLRANGLYDPDTTGVGHQPLYRDQMAALYTNYMVI